MDSKNSLVNAIKIWVKKDNEIRQLKKEERIRKKEQKEISETLMAIMKENQIDEFDLKDGKLVSLSDFENNEERDNIFLIKCNSELVSIANLKKGYIIPRRNFNN